MFAIARMDPSQHFNQPVDQSHNLYNANQFTNNLSPYWLVYSTIISRPIGQPFPQPPNLLPYWPDQFPELPRYWISHLCILLTTVLLANTYPDLPIGRASFLNCPPIG